MFVCTLRVQVEVDGPNYSLYLPIRINFSQSRSSSENLGGLQQSIRYASTQRSNGKSQEPKDGRDNPLNASQWDNVESLTPKENYQDLQSDNNGADPYEQPVSENSFENVEFIIVLTATTQFD